MLTRWLRRSFDLEQATTRLANPHDLYRVSRLFRDGAKHYYGLAGNELPDMLHQANAVVLEYGQELWAVALVCNSVHYTTWLRGVALIRGVDLLAGVGRLLPPLHQSLYRRRVRRIYYAGDETSDAWLVPVLHHHGYVLDTEVIVYEKRTLTIPSYGSQTVTIRMVQAGDCDIIHSLDKVCFEEQWAKDDATLTEAITHETFFIVAELRGQVVGYAYATSHFGGRLVHLVRLAVDPYYRGQAIGVRLLAEMIEYARNQRAHVITLNTQAYNEAAQRIYRWFGFVSTGEYQPILRYDLLR